MFRPKLIAIVLCLPALSACGTPGRPVLTQAFPAPPVDLKRPLPAPAALPKGAKLSDIMGAHLADSQAFQGLAAEVSAWRRWYSDQAVAWGTK